MVLGILIYVITKQSFLFYEDDRFMDYFSTIEICDKVYAGIGQARNYFPFAYIVLKVIGFLIQKPDLSYFITFAFTCVFIIIFYRILLKKEKITKFLAMILITFLSYPIMFEFDRANIEYLVLLFLMLFFIFYKKEKYKIAAVLLSFPICMKLYPAVFILLFLNKKRFKEFFLCIFSCIVVMISSYFLLGGRIRWIPIAMFNFKMFTMDYALKGLGVQFGHSIWSGMNYLSLITNGKVMGNTYMTIYTIIILIIALILAIYVIFIEKKEWKAITILTIMMITFPHVSFDYTLIHMYIPIVLFIAAKDTKKWENIVYSILFALTIIPMNWFQVFFNNYVTLNVGLIIRPIILISIILIMVITKLYDMKKTMCVGNKKKGLLEDGKTTS